MVGVIERLVVGGPGYVIDGGGGNPEACTAEDFARGMAHYASQNPKFKGWYNGNTRDPVLDVTDTVNAYLKEYGSLVGKYAVVKGYPVKEARLIIYGDNDHLKDMIAVKFGKTRPPARSLDAIVQGWAKGTEVERQLCPKDGNYYEVSYDCDLSVELPNGAWVWLTRKQSGVPQPSPQPRPSPQPSPQPVQPSGNRIIPLAVAGAGLVALVLLLSERR